MLTKTVASRWFIGAVVVTAWLSVHGVSMAAEQRPASTPDLRLIEAVKNGDLAAASDLLRKRMDVNAAEADGTTALHWAVRQGALDLADKLLRAGADAKA